MKFERKNFFDAYQAQFATKLCNVFLPPIKPITCTPGTTKKWNLLYPSF